MQREILPVGQGAFCLERFFNRFEAVPEGEDRVNVVCDCGSSSGHDLLRKQIDISFRYGETIHALFLSHFDEDHVNGLEYLLRHNRVEHIFFPLLTSEDKALLRLQHRLSNAHAASAGEYSFWLRFALNPFDAIREIRLEYSPMLHPVRSQEEDSPYEPDQQEFTAPVSSGFDVFDIVCGSVKSTHPIRRTQWQYIPFHFRDKARRELLKQALREEFGTCDPEKLLKLLNAGLLHRKEIKAVYQKIPGSLNTNSMTLFSGERSDHLMQAFTCERPYENCCGYFEAKSGALYMGDYDAYGAQKWQQLQNAYRDVLPYIGCLQVPHHGSKHNFNPGLLDLEDCRLYFISAGLHNRYKHPSGGVVKDILFSGKCLRIVSERPDSKITMYMM